jgi:hypothetical protein
VFYNYLFFCVQHGFTTVFLATSFLHWFLSHSSLYPHTSNSRHILKTVPLFPCTERNCSVWHTVLTALTRGYVTKYSTKLFCPHSGTFTKYIREEKHRTHLNHRIEHIHFSPRQQMILAFNVVQRFISAFTAALQLYLSWARLIHPRSPIIFP